MFIGKATKGGKTVPFKLVTKEEATYRCGEYVGDERKGFLTANGKGNMEMTFHLDHVFGSGEMPATDAMNKDAVGFEPFAKGTHTITLSRANTWATRAKAIATCSGIEVAQP